MTRPSIYKAPEPKPVETELTAEQIEADEETRYRVPNRRMRRARGLTADKYFVTTSPRVARPDDSRRTPRVRFQKGKS